MSIVYDFPAIKVKLRGDDWWKPASFREIWDKENRAIADAMLAESDNTLPEGTLVTSEHRCADGSTITLTAIAGPTFTSRPNPPYHACW